MGYVLVIGFVALIIFLGLLIQARLARLKNSKMVDAHQRISKERFLRWAKDTGLLVADDAEIEPELGSYYGYVRSSGYSYSHWYSKIRLGALIGDIELSIFYKIELEDLASVAGSLAHLLPGFKEDLAGQLCDYYNPRQLEKILKRMNRRHDDTAKEMAKLVLQELQKRKESKQAEKDEEVLAVKVKQSHSPGPFDLTDLEPRQES